MGCSPGTCVRFGLRGPNARIGVWVSARRAFGLLGLALVRFGLPVEEDAWWQSSRLVPIFNVGLDWVLPKLLALSEGLTDSVT